MRDVNISDEALISKTNRRHRRWGKAFVGMAAVVTFITAYMLILPAITIEYSCGQEEHTHTEACYEMQLICGLEEVQGSDTDGNEEAEGGHLHTEQCYERVLICGIPEHLHDESCRPGEEAAPEPDADIPAEPGTDTETEPEAEPESEAEAAPETQPEATPELENPAFPETLPQGYAAYTFAQAESGLEVLAYAPENAFSGAAVTLKAQLLAEDTAAYARAQAELDADATVSYQGFVALDIRFEDETGTELEPDAAQGPVFVKIDARSLLPAEADESTLAVHHHVEAENYGLEALSEADAPVLELTAEPAANLPVETVADQSAETGEIVVTASEADAASLDVEASFSVSGFSTFTITWSGGQKLTVHYVDEMGTEIQGPQATNVSQSRNSWVELKTYGKAISDYIYQEARLDTPQGTRATWVRYRQSWSSGWRYGEGAKAPDSGTAWSPGNPASVYLVYREQNRKVLPTIDSTAKGVTTYMFNYPEKAFEGAEYVEENSAKGATRLGIASPTLGADGFPHLTGQYGTSRESFKKFFDPTTGTKANHLYLQSDYSDTGDFCYSAFENFAELNADGNFTVYNALGSPGGGNQSFYQRGNFMPYNKLGYKEINRNLYDEKGQLLPEGSPRQNEAIYGFTDDNDYYFGMYTTAQFYQPKNGMVTRPNGANDPMVFEFVGDDDMWVYIDGVLVLDLGGIHDAQSGSINFRTGDVRYTTTPSGSEAVWNKTTIHQQFVNAGQESTQNWSVDRPNTFVDGGLHTIQIFYMERGAGASNLKLRFNLPTIPAGSLLVHKDVENYHSAQMQDLAYTMEVKVDDVPWANQPYYIYPDETNQLNTDANGQFKLKHNQTAVFASITGGASIHVTEVAAESGVPGLINELYEITYAARDANGKPIFTDGTVKMPAAGSIKVDVTNRAKFTAPLKVVKTFRGTPGQTAPDGFTADFQLYELKDTWQSLGSPIPYREFTNGAYTFMLEQGKTYAVTETVTATGETSDLLYSGTEIASTDITTTVAEKPAELSGIATLLQNDTDKVGQTITFTNIYGPPVGDLSLTKQVVRTDGVAPTGTFQFRIALPVNLAGTYLTTYSGVDAPHTDASITCAVNSENPTQATAEIALSHGETVTIHGLPLGTVVVITELTSDGYAVSWADASAPGPTFTAAPISATITAVTCINTTGARLPATGGSGIWPMILLGMILSMSAGLLLLRQTRKGEHNRQKR